MLQLVYALVQFDNKDNMEILDIFRKLEDAQAEMKHVWERDLWKEETKNKTFIMIKEYPLR
jgi:hypothetical protein